MKIEILKDLIEDVYNLKISQNYRGSINLCNSPENKVIGFKEPNIALIGKEVI